MRQKISLFFRQRLSLLLLFVIIALPLVTLSYFLIYDNYNYRSSEEQQRNLQVAEVLASEMDNYIGHVKQALHSLAALPDVKTGNSPEILKFLAGFAPTEEGISLWWVTDAKGSVVAKWPDLGDNKSAAGKEFFEEAIKGKTYVSDDMTGDITGKEIILISLPYTDPQGKIAGVVGASIPLDTLRAKLKLQVGTSGYPIMVTKSGSFLAHPQLKLVRKKVKNHDPIWQALRSGGQGTINVIAPFDGKRKLFSYVPMLQANWVVLVVQPLSELNDKLFNLFARYGLVIFLVLLAVTWAARQLVLARNREEEARVIQAEKLAVVGQLAAGWAHEIRNPLTCIKGFIQMAAARKDGTIPQEHLDIILEEIASIQDIIEENLILAKPHPASVEEVNVAQIIQEVCNLMEPEILISNIKLTNTYPPDLPPVRAERQRLKQVFVNLVKNAIEAIEAQGKGKGEISIVTKLQGKNLVITIKDTGCGMPKEIINKLGSPFVTTKKQGTGLGALVTLRIIQSHGGSVSVASTPGQGTTFTITLPTAQGAKVSG